MKRILVGMFLQMVYTVFCLAESNIGVLQASHTGYSGADDVYQLWGWNILRYYYYLYRHLFVDYPWVVRVAYGVILVSCLGFAVIFALWEFMSIFGAAMQRGKLGLKTDILIS